MSNLIESKVTTQKEDKAERILEFIQDHPQKDISHFSGKYLHLGFNWREHSFNGRLVMPGVITKALENEPDSNVTEFLFEIAWSILERNSTELLDAAFGSNDHE